MTRASFDAARGRGLCSLDVGKWLTKQQNKKEFPKLMVAARYAAAHFEVSQYAPEFVATHLKTPEEFVEFILAGSFSGPYLSILKSGVLEAWQASRASQNGEDRSKSGPVDPTLLT